MPPHSTAKERVEFGLDTIPPDRTVVVSLRDLMYVHQTLAEYVQFFHQPMHYPNLAAVEQFLGSRGSGEGFEVLCEALHRRIGNMLPADINESFDDGRRFEHPLNPAYFEPSGENDKESRQ